MGLKYIFFQASDPSSDLNLMFEYYFEEKKINMGEFGLVNTYIRFFQYAIDKEFEQVLLLEDDICFHYDFFNLFYESIMRVPPDWDIVYLGAKQYHQSRYENDCKYFYLPNEFLTGTHAMLIHSRCFSILRDHYIENQDSPVDESIKLLFRKGIIKNVFVLNPNLVITLCAEDTFSDIQSKEKNDRENYRFWGWDVSKYILE
jgi:GR25 family glycosyltransferase involved in LPS biosynthesis